MYEDPHHLKTNSIWQEVVDFFLGNPNVPKFCMGDLNNLMHVNEKCGPTPTNASRVRNFCYLVKKCGFFYLGYSGPAYTWMNKCFATNPMFQHLDRCLANAEWCAAFPRTAVFHLPMIYSDHAPILATLDSPAHKPRKPFRFENWWLLEKDFTDMAKHRWHRSNSKPFHTRTKNLVRDLKQMAQEKKKTPMSN
ncbi:hypothetical protein PR202_ga03621 [Eleusine coracana subsp. coracana]|uniref:Uncharacterized protein n=1 Tax=Eleusine coracana subsp. coracana TaxID=191504 RepID=A0AAV5BMT9_ELECO|nr:hypothetical protein PR202_ga03621 [Eleusine coracana subsp. coracana]